MPKQVLDVGNCTPDHSSIKQMIETNFDAVVTQVHDGDETVEAMTANEFDLVLINRLMDRTGASGLEIIKRIKADRTFGSTAVMMITNFEEHQQNAIEFGAVPGFGKQAMNLPTTIELLIPYLE